MNTITSHVLQEGVLKKYPLQMGPLLNRFSLLTPKSIADKYIIQDKILPVLTEANDINISLPTMYCILDTCHVILNDPISSYFPTVEATSLISCLDIMIQQLPLHEAASILSAFSSLAEEVAMEADACSKIPYFRNRRAFAMECKHSLAKLSEHLNNERDVALGHSISNTSAFPEVSVGNMYLSTFSPNAVPEKDDLRQIIFADPFDNSKLEAVMDIGKAVGEAIVAMADKSASHAILDGAEVAIQGISKQVMDYLVEVRCCVSNLQSMQEFCEKTNYDMECYFNQDTTEEDCVPDVTNQYFGWGDEDILCHGTSTDTGKMDDALQYIFSKPNITGKNIQYVLGAVGVTSNDLQRKGLVESLKNSVCNTLLWESQQSNYVDLPINTFMKRTKQLMENLAVNTVYEKRLSEAFGITTKAMVSTMEEAGIIQQGVFQPAPSALSLCPFPVGVRLTQQYFDDIHRAETDEELTEAMIQFTKGFVTESNAISKGARSASREVQHKTEKAIRNVGGTSHEVKQAIKNAVNPMERYITQMTEKLKKADRDERREVILKGGTMPKVLRWVKRSIPIAIGAVVAAHGIPIAAVASGIALLGYIGSDITLDQRERRKLLRELEDELEIVKEKIDDSRGDENKQKKYELIRIRNDLQRNIDKIRYHLKD